MTDPQHLNFPLTDPPSLRPASGLRISSPADPLQWAHARALVEQYVDSLDLDLSFQGIAQELAQFQDRYSPPCGRLLIATLDDAVLAGCVGLREFEPGVAEIKRLYVLPVARGRGVGPQLVDAILAQARELGYRRVRLDTLPAMRSAQALYLKAGFRDIAAYRDNPVPGTRFMELDLSRCGSGRL